MEEKLKEFKALYNATILQGICKNQKEFAEYIGISPTTVSLALKGDDRYLTDLLLYKVRKAVPTIQTQQSGNQASNIQGNNTQTNLPTDFADLLRTSQNQINTLLAQQAEFLRIITNLTNR